MSEPGEVTNVIDAFEEGSPFSIHVTVAFDYSNKSATILRETSIAAPGLTTGGYTSHLLNVATYGESTSRLTPRLDVGLYKDIAAHVAFPLILANSRQLSTVGGVPPIADATAGSPGEQLFSVPFTGPTRSGIEHIAAGVDFGLLNQARNRTEPTWVLGVEGRFSVGAPMHACNAKAALQCADPSDVNRNGKSDGTFEGNFTGTRDPGISRGTIGVEVHTMMSKRLKYVEPYGGFAALFEFQQASSDYGLTDVVQSLVNHPPAVGTVTLGMMIMPWENRESFQRLTFDLRMLGQYHSEGRDYSELFDALGSSSATSLRTPNWAGYTGNPSVIDPGSQKVYVTGLSDVASYGSFRGSASAMWQVGRYLKFRVGLGYRHDQGHNITQDSPCSPASTTSVEKSGPCHTSNANGTVTVTGLPNPNYRPTVSSVGRRFWIDGSNTVDVFGNAVLMF